MGQWRWQHWKNQNKPNWQVQILSCNKMEGLQSVKMHPLQVVLLLHKLARLRTTDLLHEGISYGYFTLVKPLGNGDRYLISSPQNMKKMPTTEFCWSFRRFLPEVRSGSCRVLPSPSGFRSQICAFRVSNAGGAVVSMLLQLCEAGVTGDFEGDRDRHLCFFTYIGNYINIWFWCILGYSLKDNSKKNHQRSYCIVKGIVSSQIYRRQLRWPFFKKNLVVEVAHKVLDGGFLNCGTPKWMVKIMENPIKMDDLGVSPFKETPRSKTLFLGDAKISGFFSDFGAVSSYFFEVPWVCNI